MGALICARHAFLRAESLQFHIVVRYKFEVRLVTRSTFRVRANTPYFSGLGFIQHCIGFAACHSTHVLGLRVAMAVFVRVKLRFFGFLPFAHFVFCVLPYAAGLGLSVWFRLLFSSVARFFTSTILSGSGFRCFRIYRFALWISG